MSRFFKPYEGNRPYLFISYAHKQSEEVVSTIRILHEKGWRLWYDEGIPAGSDWPANIAAHMQGCAGVIFFESERALESPNCYSEMSTAYRLKKPCMVVRLEDTQRDKKWKDILEGKKEIPVIDSPEARAEAILKSGFVTRRYHRSWTEHIPWSAIGLTASLLFFLLSAGALFALRSGLWNPAAPAVNEAAVEPETAEPEEEEAVPEVIDLGEAERFFAVTFPDADQERAIRSALGISEGDIMRGQMADLDRLYIGCLSPVPPEQIEQYKQLHPNCIVNTTTEDPTEESWRYGDIHNNGGWEAAPRYEQLRLQFEYDNFPTCYAYRGNDPLEYVRFDYDKDTLKPISYR